MNEDILDIHVRPAELRDADVVYDLLSQFVVSYRPIRDAFDRNFPAIVASPDASSIVAECRDVVIGYALALRMPTLYANGDLWNLQELMVDAEHRGRGVGRALLNRTIDDARARGAIEVVVPSRRAGGYYLKNGFVEAATLYKFKLSENQ